VWKGRSVFVITVKVSKKPPGSTDLHGVTSQNIEFKLTRLRGAPGGGEGLPVAPTRKPPKTEIKKKIVYIMISKVLRDFPVSRNQPLKSADDWYIKFLKNRLIKLNKTRR
jgi:hypothetical protein